MAGKRTSGEEDTPQKYCGIIRPIADFDPYPSGHWEEVHQIVAQAIDAAGYSPRLVSESEAASVIQGNIVTNLYEDEIVVCDVSGRNPNVMFELGMRVAFEKPVVIIKDEITPFSFDVSPIKHLTYPSSLRFSGMVRLKNDIASTIAGTMEAVKRPEYRGYLQQFGTIRATEIGEQTVTVSEMAEELRELQRAMNGLQSSVSKMVTDTAVRSALAAASGKDLEKVGNFVFYQKGLLDPDLGAKVSNAAQNALRRTVSEPIEDGHGRDTRSKK